ncbi:MAG: glycosyltransferase [Saprospiraceae bacterium]|nr:glycosyltransferase [Candidatus Opimibacter skivensis]
MVTILTVLWLCSLLILMGYHFLIFRSRNKTPARYNGSELPGVSIVIAVKNGSETLIKHFEAFLSQEYPLYEIIIVNDHSSTEEQKNLEEMVQGLAQVTLYHSTDQPGKKQALTLGINKAKYELILCTDADCRPAGKEWIESMVMLSHGDNLVLGYSPYEQTKGLLNLFIRFETVMTGIQYLSWAVIGSPYMGVGRNMLYPRKLFQQEDPYKDQKHIPYGDDDLWVQQASSKRRLLSIQRKHHMSFHHLPPSWKQWFKQKHRHLSAGHHYQMKAWWQPGLYAMALMSHWVLLPFLMMSSPDNMILAGFFLGLAVRWDTYRRWTSRLGDRDTALWYPFLEVGYALYLAVMGFITIVAKKQTWN